MPTDACVVFYDCKGCGETLKPLPGSCCVFCSYGSVPCPPIQEGAEPCCTPKQDPRSKDWVGSSRMSLLAWWLPSAAIVAGLFAPIPARTIIWTVALAWMGIACVLNAQQCGRTHCRYTGPYYLAMIVPVAVVGLGIVQLSAYGWLALGTLILGGGYTIWWATERLWGKFAAPTLSLTPTAVALEQLCGRHRATEFKDQWVPPQCIYDQRHPHCTRQEPKYNLRQLPP